MIRIIPLLNTPPSLLKLKICDINFNFVILYYERLYLKHKFVPTYATLLKKLSKYHNTVFHGKIRPNVSNPYLMQRQII